MQKVKMHIPDFLTKMLEDIAHTEGFIKYKLEQESGSSHGDNYIGVVISLKLVGDRVIDGAVATESLYLICKVAPESKDRRDAFQAVAAFEREIFMYTRLLPTFVKFQQEKGLTADESFLSFPKVYAWTADKETETYALIMEDMRPKHFVMWPRHEPIDFCHEKLLLTQLGRFHGVSLALKDQRPEVFDEFKKLNDIFGTLFEKGRLEGMMESAFDRAIMAMQNDRHKRLVRGLKTNFLSLLNESFTTEAVERFGVINHGDCWINNFLFHYDENSKALKDICFLDWQLSRYASPALDILFHIFTSTRKGLRDQSYTELLRIYYTALSETVCKLGSDPDKLFRYSDLTDELKAHGKFALVMGVLLVAFVLAKQEDVLNIDEYFERVANGENVNVFTNSGKDNDVYVKAVNDLIGDVIAYGYNH